MATKTNKNDQTNSNDWIQIKEINNNTQIKSISPKNKSRYVKFSLVYVFIMGFVMIYCHIAGWRGASVDRVTCLCGVCSYRMLSLMFPLSDELWGLVVDVLFHVWKSRRAWLSLSIQSSLSCLVSAENQHLAGAS